MILSLDEMFNRKRWDFLWIYTGQKKKITKIITQKILICARNNTVLVKQFSNILNNIITLWLSNNKRENKIDMYIWHNNIRVVQTHFKSTAHSDFITFGNNFKPMRTCKIRLRLFDFFIRQKPIALLINNYILILQPCLSYTPRVNLNMTCMSVFRCVCV